MWIRNLRSSAAFRYVLATLLLSMPAAIACAGKPGTGTNLRYALYIKENVEGWSDAGNGQIAGSTGRSWKTDAFVLSGLPFRCEYRIHVEGQGWLSWTPSGQFTSGNGRRLEAIQFRFPAGIPADTVLLGRVHLQFAGWTETVRIQNMTVVGTTGESRRLEAIQIALGSGAEFRNPSYIDALNHRLFQLDRGLRAHTITPKQAVEQLNRDPASVGWGCSWSIIGSVASTVGMETCAVPSPLCIVAVVGKVASTAGIITSCTPPAQPSAQVAMEIVVVVATIITPLNPTVLNAMPTLTE